MVWFSCFVTALLNHLIYDFKSVMDVKCQIQISSHQYVLNDVCFRIVRYIVCVYLDDYLLKIQRRNKIQEMLPSSCL